MAGVFGVQDLGHTYCDHKDCPNKATKSLRRFNSRTWWHNSNYYFCDEHEEYFIKLRRKIAIASYAVSFLIIGIMVLIGVLTHHF